MLFFNHFYIRNQFLYFGYVLSLFTLASRTEEIDDNKKLYS